MSEGQAIHSEECAPSVNAVSFPASARQQHTPSDGMLSSDARSSRGAVDRWGSGFPPGPLGAELGLGADHPRGPVGSVPFCSGPQLPDSVSTHEVSSSSVSALPSCFRMGELFPFLSLPSVSLPSSPSPCSPSPSLSASTPVVLPSSSVSLTGKLFPFDGYFSQTKEAVRPRLFQSLGQWVASKGGRVAFCSWLG